MKSMNIRHIIFCFLIVISSVSGAQELMVNEIRAIVYHKGGSVPIADSDLKSLDGHRVTLRDAVLRQLMVIHGQQFTQVTEDDVEKTLAELQKANGLTREAMLHAFEVAGFSQEEGLSELKRQQIVSQVIEVRVRSDKRLIIQKSDVEAYDREHPAFIEPVYTLQQVCLPDLGAADKVFSQAEIDALHWEPAFDVKESELVEDKKFIADAQEGTIVSRERVDEGIELTRLVRKTAGERIPLDKRYDDIMDILHRERFATVLHDFQRDLLNGSSVWFSHPEDREMVMAEASANEESHMVPAV